MNIIPQIFNAILNVHPWHSMLVHFPIGLTGAALLFLVLALWRRNESLERAAFYTLALAGASGVLAAVTGYRDFVVRFEGEAPLINVKIFLSITLLALILVTALSRWRRHEIAWTPSTMVLYLAAFAGCFLVATTLGFAGGVILYGL